MDLVDVGTLYDHASTVSTPQEDVVLGQVPAGTRAEYGMPSRMRRAGFG